MFSILFSRIRSIIKLNYKKTYWHANKKFTLTFILKLRLSHWSVAILKYFEYRHKFWKIKSKLKFSLYRYTFMFFLIKWSIINLQCKYQCHTRYYAYLIVSLLMRIEWHEIIFHRTLKLYKISFFFFYYTLKMQIEFDLHLFWNSSSKKRIF